MINRLFGLGHNAIIGGHHKNDNVGTFGTPRPHCGKCRVTRCIQERHHAVIGIHMVGTNMLSDATRLTVGHLAFSNVIQQ